MRGIFYYVCAITIFFLQLVLFLDPLCICAPIICFFLYSIFTHVLNAPPKLHQKDPIRKNLAFDSLKTDFIGYKGSLIVQATSLTVESSWAVSVSSLLLSCLAFFPWCDSSGVATLSATSPASVFSASSSAALFPLLGALFAPSFFFTISECLLSLPGSWCVSGGRRLPFWAFLFDGLLGCFRCSRARCFLCW